MQTNLLKPKSITVESLDDNRAEVILEPFERGYGHTLGNALRRVLLSSMVGYAPTEVTIAGVVHEYSTLDGVQEDVVNILLNLKGVVYEAIRESSRNIFPVLDREKGSLEGVILLDDIRHLIFEKELYEKVSVLEMMQPPPALIQMGVDTMNQVMDKFQSTGAWNLPVVKDGKYIGFISKSKLLTVYRRKLIYFSNNK